MHEGGCEMYPLFMVEWARQQMRERHDRRYPDDTAAALVTLRVRRLQRRDGA